MLQCSAVEIKLKSPLDMHIHLRQGDLLQAVVSHTARAFAGAVAMPNTLPPVDSLERLQAYRREILSATGDAPFEPLMVLFLRDYSEAELAAARPHLMGVKLYPEGITTNSSGGVRSLDEAEKVLARMEALGIPLMVHGETNGFTMEREAEFGAWYAKWARKFPELQITMEHVTDRRNLALIDKFENLRATITLHHLLFTLDDLIGGSLNPFLFCKPVVKTPADRDALREAALNAHPKVMFGSDSAPHPRPAKIEKGAAGVYSAPVLLPKLVEFFEQHSALHNLPAFVSYNARTLYRYEPIERVVTLRK
ncbi:MAG: dihydroorotase, partial [Opitutales bacterium]